MPILKKSASFANSSARITLAGVSIIIPVSISSQNALPSSRSSFLHSSTTSFASLNSSRDIIIGNIIRTFPKALARSIARSCSLNISFISSDMRIALQPRNGLSSFSKSKYGSSLSPPISSVRIVSSCGQSMAARLYTSNCSSSVGKCVFSIYKSSLLKRPTPSIFTGSAFSMSSALPALIQSEIFLPSFVITGLFLNFSGRCFSFI